MRSRSLAALTALAVASVPFLTGSALSADAVLGETFTDAGDCELRDNTVLQTGPSSYVAPSAGILTSWRTSSQTAYVVGFRVGRPVDAETYTIVAADAQTAVPAGAFQQSVRIPVRAGDVIGFYVPVQGALGGCAKEADPTFTYALADGNPGVGEPVPAGSTRAQLNLAATLESDADGDGFGDTSQDRCPTQASTQGACRDTTAPETTIGSGRAKRIKAVADGKRAKKKAKVTVTFAGSEASTFACSVDAGAAVGCVSPFTIKLRKGRHTITVTATDAAGNTDASAATTTVRVKKAKRTK